LAKFPGFCFWARASFHCAASASSSFWRWTNVSSVLQKLAAVSPFISPFPSLRLSSRLLSTWEYTNFSLFSRPSRFVLDDVTPRRLPRRAFHDFCGLGRFFMPASSCFAAWTFLRFCRFRTVCSLSCQAASARFLCLSPRRSVSFLSDIRSFLRASFCA